jgi:uncharacterized protein
MKASYELVFGNLKIENHQFEYLLDKKFFELFDSSESEDGEVSVLINIEKAASHLDMNFTLKGWVLCDCDVCLSGVRIPVKGEHYLHVKLTDKILPDEAEIMYVESNKFKLDLTQLLYEYTFLSLPFRKLCEESLNKKQCDNSFIDKMNEEIEQDTDPQWDKLKGLFKNKT